MVGCTPACKRDTSLLKSRWCRSAYGRRGAAPPARGVDLRPRPNRGGRRVRSRVVGRTPCSTTRRRVFGLSRPCTKPSARGPGERADRLNRAPPGARARSRCRLLVAHPAQPWLAICGRRAGTLRPPGDGAASHRHAEDRERTSRSRTGAGASTRLRASRTRKRPMLMCAPRTPRADDFGEERLRGRVRRAGRFLGPFRSSARTAARSGPFASADAADARRSRRGPRG